MSTELVHILHLATGNASGNSRLMEDMLYINSVNLHHSFFAEESESNMQFSFTQGQDHCYFCGNGTDLCLRCNPGLTAKCEILKGKFHPHTSQSPDIHCDAGAIL